MSFRVIYSVFLRLFALCLKNFGQCNSSLLLSREPAFVPSDLYLPPRAVAILDG